MHTKLCTYAVGAVEDMLITCVKNDVQPVATAKPQPSENIVGRHLYINNIVFYDQFFKLSIILNL